jgi:hypothetical protein
MFKLFIKFSTIGGNQNQCIQDVLYISRRLLAPSVIQVTSTRNWFTISGTIKNIMSATTRINHKNINSIQIKSFIFHLFSLFKKGEKSTHKNNDNTSNTKILEILYKNQTRINNQITVKTFFTKYLYSRCCASFSLIIDVVNDNKSILPKKLKLQILFYSSIIIS